MNVLQIFLFGQVKVIHTAQQAPANVTHATQSLLAYLLVARDRYHPRELLASQFWGEQSQERARRCLNTALWRLRNVLEPDGIPRGTYLLTTSAGEVGFNLESDYWLDAAAFESQVGRILTMPSQTMSAQDAERLANSLQLYQGELLEGFYDDWAVRERERLRRLYLNSLAHLMSYHKHHQMFEKSLTYGRQILDLDPLREEIHREMMRLYCANGQRTLAVQQYHHCCRILADELGIAPMEETQTLYTQLIESTCWPAISPSLPRAALLRRSETLPQLQQAIDHLDKARQYLQQAARIIQKSMDYDN